MSESAEGTEQNDESAGQKPDCVSPVYFERGDRLAFGEGAWSWMVKGLDGESGVRGLSTTRSRQGTVGV